MNRNGERFVGMRNERVNAALAKMGIDVAHVRRVIIDLPYDDAATVYVQLLALDGPTADILEVLPADVRLVIPNPGGKYVEMTAGTDEFKVFAPKRGGADW